MTNEKRLIIMRHANAGWSARDQDRPLTRGGVDNAARIGEEIGAAGWTPSQILSSDSRRTKDTVAAMAPAFGALNAEFTRALYVASVPAMRSVIATATATDVLLVVAHNPGCSDLVLELTGQAIIFTPATAVLLTSDAADWDAAIEAGAPWSIAQVLTP